MPTSTSEPVWGSVSCPKTLWHADQGNWTSDPLIKRRWLFPEPQPPLFISYFITSLLTGLHIGRWSARWWSDRWDTCPVAVLPTGDIGACLGCYLVRGAKYAARKKNIIEIIMFVYFSTVFAIPLSITILEMKKKKKWIKRKQKKWRFWRIAPATIQADASCSIQHFASLCAIKFKTEWTWKVLSLSL